MDTCGAQITFTHVAAFGMPNEPEPGALAIAASAVQAIHLTKLNPDGSGKADIEPNKVFIASPGGHPIVLAPPNDLLGLAIAEGIEDALCGDRPRRMGCGTGRYLPALADVVPEWIESITICVDDDPAGRENSLRLADGLQKRGFAIFFYGEE